MLVGIPLIELLPLTARQLSFGALVVAAVELVYDVAIHLLEAFLEGFAAQDVLLKMASVVVIDTDLFERHCCLGNFHFVCTSLIDPRIRRVSGSMTNCHPAVRFVCSHKTFVLGQAFPVDHIHGLRALSLQSSFNLVTVKAEDLHFVRRWKSHVWRPNPWKSMSS